MFLKKLFRFLFSVLVGWLLFSCNKAKDTDYWPFESLVVNKTNVTFKNEVYNDKDFNIFLYRNFYNGGGVGIGDLNNDQLPDIYFASNMGSNRLFLNKGNLTFEDITDWAKVGSVNKWSTGVSMVDVNGDGLLDIYVCNAGFRKGADQRNELYLNNGDLTFTESAAQYNLDNNGYSTHAAFFDYDKDGDLDAYILNNSFMPVNTLNYANKRELPAEEWPVKDFLKGGGDKLMRNDNGKFVDVTKESGVYSSLIGFGLGITVGDVNLDGWEDIYVSNDFFERDYLYINQHDGSFEERLTDYMTHVSAFSMGADMADINNDGYPDLFVTDMLPDDDYRLKTSTSFDDYKTFDLKLQRGFFYQYMQNTLQLNTRNNSFAEVAYYGGVAASDWSWGALIFDVNNDGLRDIYVCNGVAHDVTNQDFIDFFANETMMATALNGPKSDVDQIIARMPSVPLKNKLFLNNGNLTFSDVSNTEANAASFSNGAAYGDLDNDGDLDLVVNNVNQDAFVLRNLTSERSANHYIQFILEGVDKNTRAIGTKLTLYAGEQKMYYEHIPSRGFQSSCDYKVTLGLGEVDKVDSAVITWPDLRASVYYNVAVDSVYTISQRDAREAHKLNTKANNVYFVETDDSLRRHVEEDFVDFYSQNLLMKMLSREGPKGDVGDVNGDGLMDVYVAGASHQPGTLYVQTASGLNAKEERQFDKDAFFEDTAVCFFDADGDGDNDLFVGSGGNHSYQGSTEMQDRIYINDGTGKFTLKAEALPNNGYNTAVGVPIDFDGDGDLDLFVGSRSVPGQFGPVPPSFFYENNGKGIFSLAASRQYTAFRHLGFVTDACAADVDGDGYDDLTVVGEWMHPRIISFAKGTPKEISSTLEDYAGWWTSVYASDFDRDGKVDLALGNTGENFYLQPSHTSAAKLWVTDFDDNGAQEAIATIQKNGKDMPVVMKKELTQQIASLRKQNLNYSDYASKSIQELFSADVLKRAQVHRANFFESCIAYNNGEGEFEVVPLPQAAQFSSVQAIAGIDVDEDGYEDLITAGNFSWFQPQYSKLDAGKGDLLMNRRSRKFSAVPSRESGLNIKGDCRQILSFTELNESKFIFLINDEKPKVYKLIR